MKLFSPTFRPSAAWGILLSTAFGLFVSGCQRQTPSSFGATSEASLKLAPTLSSAGLDACQLVLAPPPSNGRIEREMMRLQERVRAGREEFQSLERLGWLYVAKARESFDPGFYKLAEQCALCLESRQPHAFEALLLHGHVLHSLHRFKEAEPLARELVSGRGLSFDYGLLGDVLMEQGRLDEAARVYQQMVDRRPDLEAYARIAHLRWLKGDLQGATEVMRLAVSAASPRAPEPAAWVNTRLAFLLFQAGKLVEAEQRCEVALDFQAHYAPALLLRGRLLLSEGKLDAAVQSLQEAAQFNPLPEYQWTLTDALRAAGREAQARQVETQLLQGGEANDPRTFCIYLATRGESLSTALTLARNELNTRADVFTHDALAWALSANGQHLQALKEMEQALAQGTQDARLFFHAALITAKAGQPERARQWTKKAGSLAALLLPSEQAQLAKTEATLAGSGFPTAAALLVQNTPFTPDIRTR